MRPSLNHFFTKTFKAFGLLPDNDAFNPRMVQKPAIGLGNTGRYFLDAQMVAFNAPVRGTLAPNANSSGTAWIDVNQHVVGPTQGFTVPNVPGRQGLIAGFRSVDQ